MQQSEYYGSFIILPAFKDIEKEIEALESMGDVICDVYIYWKIDAHNIEPRSAASEAHSDDVFEELVEIIKLLEEMGWEIWGRIIRYCESIDCIDLYFISTEDGEIHRKRGYLNDVD